MRVRQVLRLLVECVLTVSITRKAHIVKCALSKNTIIFLWFCFSASCAESPTKRSITLEVHPSIVQWSPIFSDMRQVKDLITRRNPAPQSCLCIVYDHKYLPLVLFFRQFCWISHQEINHPRSASKNIAIQPNFKDLITQKNPTPQSCVLFVEDWLHKERGRFNFTFVKEKCIT